MRKIISFIAAMTLATIVHAGEPQADVALTTKDAARVTAVLDSVSTYAVLQAGGYERNPLVNTSPGGLIALAGLKWGLVELIDRSNLPEVQKRKYLKTTTALWGGVSANNIMLALSASNPASLVVGVVTGIYLWNATYADELAKQPPESELAPSVVTE